MPQKSVDAQFYIQDDARFGKFRRLRSSISDSFNRGCKCLPQCFGTIGKYFSGSFLHESWSKKKVLDPQGAFLQKWNKIFILSCVIAVSIDPLFFYIPVINNDKKCLHLDHKLEVIASVLRSFTDIFYVLHIVFQFRTGFIAPSSRVFGRGVLVEDGKEIAKRYMSSYFWIDIFAVLPLPQV